VLTQLHFAFDSRHMVLALGRGHNASNVVQTLGRATFNGRSVLNENGFENVTVLMTSNDLTMCVKTQNYVNHIAHRMQKGDSFAAAMTGANEEIPDTANWIRHTFREPGRIKGTIHGVFDLVAQSIITHSIANLQLRTNIRRKGEVHRTCSSEQCEARNDS
jgi:hypothetical protein